MVTEIGKVTEYGKALVIDDRANLQETLSSLRDGIEELHKRGVQAGHVQIEMQRRPDLRAWEVFFYGMATEGP